MFLHNFKYGLLMSVRNKTQIFWSLLFAMILGTLFYSTFGNAYSLEINRSVEVACCIQNEEIKNAFEQSVAGITRNEEGDLLLDISYTDNLEEAEKLLEERDVAGILYSDEDTLKLIVKRNGIDSSVLTTIVEQFHQNQIILGEIVQKEDDKLIGAVAELFAERNNNQEIKLADINMSPYLLYFYNLIAMSCLFASFSALEVASRNQGNLSAVGARKCVAKRNIFVGSIAELIAHVVVMTILTLLAFAYLLILGVDFGDKLAAISLTIFVGTIMGSAFGFFIGSFNLSAGVKDGITVGVSLALCFFSGLMVADFRPMIEENCPILNDINPAAMICDSLYALNVYDTYNRFFANLISMLITSAIFIIGGILVGRRKSYASL